MSIELIKNKILKGEYRLEVEDAIINGEIIKFSKQKCKPAKTVEVPVFDFAENVC